jgi:hypothetical protein
LVFVTVGTPNEEWQFSRKLRGKLELPRQTRKLSPKRAGLGGNIFSALAKYDRLVIFAPIGADAHLCGGGKQERQEARTIREARLTRRD